MGKEWKTIGARVVFARERLELSQKEVSRRIAQQFPGTKLSQQRISKIESGEEVRSAYLIELAVVLGVSPIWLRTGALPMRVVYSSEFARRAARALEDIPEEALEKVVGMLELLAHGLGRDDDPV